MKRILLIAIGLLLAWAAPALAGEGQEETTPTTGGPVVTIPIDRADIDQLVIIDLALSRQTGLSPGDPIRVSGHLAAGVPSRTIVLIEGVGELAGDVTVAADGAFDHEVRLPVDLPPGSYALSMRSEGLGRAFLGQIEVESARTGTSEPEPTSVPALPAPGDEAETGSVDASTLATEGAASEGGLDTALIALAAAVALVLTALWWRYRAKRRPKLERLAALPTATTLPSRIPSDDPAAKPQLEAGSDRDVSGVAEEERLDPSTTARKRSPVSSPAAANADPVLSAGDSSSDGTSVVAHPRAKPRAGTQPGTREAAYVLVEVLNRRVGAGEERSERRLAGFDSSDAAKEAGRKIHAACDPWLRDEIWWEVRLAGRSAIWMVHAWAASEYDLGRMAGGDAQGMSSDTA